MPFSFVLLMAGSVTTIGGASVDSASVSVTCTTGTGVVSAALVLSAPLEVLAATTATSTAAATPAGTQRLMAGFGAGRRICRDVSSRRVAT